MTDDKYTEEFYHDARMQVFPTIFAAMAKWQADADAAYAAGDYLTLATATKHLASLARQLAYGAANEASYTGATWEEIGLIYGITKQAAQQRFTRPLRDN